MFAANFCNDVRNGFYLVKPNQGNYCDYTSRLSALQTYNPLLFALQSLNNLAMVLTSQGKAGEALSLLQAAISALPDYAEAHNNLGVLQRDVGAIPDALTSYERALALVPDSRNAGDHWLVFFAPVVPVLRRHSCD